MENKRKLIPNTLIIGNEHLSYPVSAELVSYAMSKPTTARRGEALNAPAPRASAASRGARRAHGSRLGTGTARRRRRHRHRPLARPAAALCWRPPAPAPSCILPPGGLSPAGGKKRARWDARGAERSFSCLWLVVFVPR